MSRAGIPRPNGLLPGWSREYLEGLAERNKADNARSQEIPADVDDLEGHIAWAVLLIAYLIGETDVLDFQGQPIPARLKEILERAFPGAVEALDQLKVCPQCKGSGMVQVAPNARGIKRCPACHPGGQR